MNNVLSTCFKIAGGIVVVSVAAGVTAFVKERIDEKKESETLQKHPQGFYERYVKRPLDCTLATGALIVLSPVLAVTALVVRTKLGSPVVFTQDRPGKEEKFFKLYKFRTMTDARDENGELLPDKVRLTRVGRAIRESSCDELLELVNIIKGDMAVVGPRPQLVRDMVFMTPKQRRRHSVRPGLTGLAQINGRNELTWEEKLEWDLRYLDKITFVNDAKIVLRTIAKIRHKEGITDGENATALDFGDELLKDGKVDQATYNNCQIEAKKLLKKAGN